MTTGQNSMAASSTCGLMTANRGRGGNVPVAREILPPALGAGSLDAHHRIFGIGEVAEAGALRALEIFRHVAAAIPARQARYWRVSVDHHERQAAARQPPAERASETHEVGDIAAIDQLRVRHDATH